MTVDDVNENHHLIPVPDDGVACPRCGEVVHVYASQCRSCGVKFLGPAWQVGRRSHQPRSYRRRFLIWLAILIALLFMGPMLVRILGLG